MSLPREIDDAPAGEPDTELAETEDGHAHRREPDAQAPPHKLGRFVVLGLLGQGGMGSVLRAYDATLDRQVAVKLMRTGGRRGQDRRMLREAQALARLSHPNVVQVYEVGEFEGQLFIAMELIVGKTLQKWQAERHSWRECLDVYLQAGRGLAAAHAAGLIHRDFKPANCILDEAGRARVLDFGLVRYDGDDAGEHATEVDTDAPMPAPAEPARALRPAPGKDEPSEPTAAQLQNALQEQLTQTGTIMGTVAYMAPEQVRGGDVDARSDQFSFCVSLYEALFGQRPFTDTPMAELLLMAFGRPVSPLPPPPGIRVPRWLVRALHRGLSAVPADRWPSMDALLAELARHRTRTWARWVAWSLAIAGVGWVLGGRSTRLTLDSCDRAGHEISATWSVDRRQRAHDAIIATELPYAEETWSKLDPKLDAYARELAAAEVAACEHRDEGPHGRCLDARVRALHRTAFLLEGADARTVDSAAVLVAELPPIARCDEALATDDVDPSRTPPQQAEVDRLRARLELARALARMGKLEEALREVGPVVGEAVALDDPAFLAEAHLAEGFILLRDSKLEPAEDRLRAAFRGAVGHDTGKVALEVATSLTYLVGVKQGRSEAGLWLGSTAEALADRHDPHGHLHAEALTAIAQVLADRGQYAEAQQRYEDALEIFVSLVGDHHLALVVPLNGLGQVLKDQRQLDRARACYERALAIRIDELGERHPQTAYQRIHLGAVLTERSELAAAESEFQRAREILALLPSQRELLAELHTDLGVLRGKQQGRAEEGEHELRRAIEHWEALYGSSHPVMAKGRMNLGANLYRRDLYEQAAKQYELALGILERNEPTPANDKLHLRLLHNLARTRTVQGRYDEVEPNHRRALEILERQGKAGDTEAAKLHNRIGALYFTQGRFPDSIREHETGLAILEAMPEPDLTIAAETLFQVGRAQHAAGRPELARSHVDHAIELGLTLSGNPGFDSDRLAEYSRLRAELDAIVAERRRSTR